MYFWFIVFAAINGLLVTLLAMNVSYNRMTLKIANGDGGDVDMRKAIRAHGNAVEHCLLFGMMMWGIVLSQGRALNGGCCQSHAEHFLQHGT